MNFLGEFTDPSLEEEFFQQDMKKALPFIRAMGLFFAILNTLFLIPDYFFLQNKNAFAGIAIGRIIFFVLVLKFFFVMKHINNGKVLSYWITLYEILGMCLFLFVFYQYKNPNYLIQAFGVMVFIIVVFMVPNRWVNMLFATSFVSIGFVTMSFWHMQNIDLSEFLAGIVYIIIVIALCSIMTIHNHYYKRIQYANSKELTRLSITDHLSGIYNRTKLDEELARWIQYSRRYDVPLSIIIFDFDDFKDINDTYGHLVGDEVLIESVSIINGMIRELDIFARWGGEEFVILLPNTDKLNAVNLAERIRSTVEKTSFEKVSGITCSFGVAQLSTDDGVESFLRKADKKLYLAKDAGTNGVKW